MKTIKLFLSVILISSATCGYGQSLRKQNAALKDSITVINQSLTNEKLVSDSLKQENQQLFVNNRTLKANNTSLEEHNDSLELVIEKQNGEYESLSRQNDSLRLELDVTKGILAQKEVMIDSLLTTVDNLNFKNANLENYYKKQDRIWGRKKYFNIGYNIMHLSNDAEGARLTNKTGGSITIGRTFYLHKAPILGIIKFGIDWSFLDINFSQYNYEYLSGDGYSQSDYDYGYDNDYGYESDSYLIYKSEIGMQIGPSMTINPVDFLKINIYYRYSPCYSMVIDDGFVFNGSYGSYMNIGAAVSYKVISIGYEKRWGKSDISYDDATRWDANGSRIYIGFRF